MKKVGIIDWILRLVKGAFIGTGFILPGVSGGALAAIFGLYERLIAFIANITKDFKKNLLFFIPVGIGMVISIVGLAYPLGFFLEHYNAATMWFFIGAIIGTMPTLWKEAGKQGRSAKHYIILTVALVIGYAFLHWGEKLLGGQMPLNFFTWILAGVLIALGVLVPGLSPSNFLLYMGMYEPMLAGIKALDFSVILPILLGAVACMLAFSKLINYLFKKAYTGLFHIILGVVIASTLAIVPLDFNYLSLPALICLATCIGGILLGYWMGNLEAKYKPE